MLLHDKVFYDNFCNVIHFTIYFIFQWEYISIYPKFVCLDIGKIYHVKKDDMRKVLLILISYKFHFIIHIL